MKKLTILVDMDDTIENLCETWVGALNMKHGLSVSMDDIREWDMRKAFPELTTDDIFAPLKEKRFWKSVKPLPYAADVLRRLKDDGHDVYIVTASNPATLSCKLSLVLFRYFPFIGQGDVIVTSKKQMIRGDVLVDDAPHNLVGGEYAGILMAAPHNREFDADAHGFYRASDWLEIYGIICRIAGGEGGE